MAETKNMTNNAKVKKVEVRLPRNQGKDARQEEFFSVNGRNYLIKRGEYVEVTPEIDEVIKNGELAEIAAYNYIDELKERDAESRAICGLN